MNRRRPRKRRDLSLLPGLGVRVLRETKERSEARMRGFDELPPVVREVMTAVADYTVARTMIGRFGVRDYAAASDMLARLAEARRTRG